MLAGALLALASLGEIRQLVNVRATALEKETRWGLPGVHRDTKVTIGLRREAEGYNFEGVSTRHSHFGEHRFFYFRNVVTLFERKEGRNTFESETGAQVAADSAGNDLVWPMPFSFPALLLRPVLRIYFPAGERSGSWQQFLVRRFRGHYAKDV